MQQRLRIIKPYRARVQVNRENRERTHFFDKLVRSEKRGGLSGAMLVGGEKITTEEGGTWVRGPKKKNEAAFR